MKFFDKNCKHELWFRESTTGKNGEWYCRYCFEIMIEDKK